MVMVVVLSMGNNFFTFKCYTGILKLFLGTVPKLLPSFSATQQHLTIIIIPFILKKKFLQQVGIKSSAFDDEGCRAGKLVTLLQEITLGKSDATCLAGGVQHSANRSTENLLVLKRTWMEMQCSWVEEPRKPLFAIYEVFQEICCF